MEDVTWTKASFSTSGACVEVARTGEHVVVRHSRQPDGQRLVYTPTEFAAFVKGIKANEFDHLA